MNVCVHTPSTYICMKWELDKSQSQEEKAKEGGLGAQTGQRVLRWEWGVGIKLGRRYQEGSKNC